MTSLIDPLKRFLVPPSDPSQHRLFHGRGRTVPGLDWLTVDRYSPVLVATTFAPQAAEVMTELEHVLSDCLQSLSCTALVIQQRYNGEAKTDIVVGELPELPAATEDGLQFILDFQRGQNIGFFADMVPARRWLSERAAGKNILNLFAFTCAFSVVAAAAGAEQVVNIDLSKPALALGQRSHRLNNLEKTRLHFLPHDIFRSWKKLHSLGRYDLIIVDPPTEQKGSFVARKDYEKLLRHLHRLLKPEAELLICLNAPWLGEDFLEEIVAENLAGAEKVQRLPFAPGFVDENPQAGLKVLHYKYQRPDDL